MKTLKPEELRIGNLVKNWDMKHFGGEVKVGEVHAIEAGDFQLWAELYEPIPLTAEWLERLGFKKLIVESVFEKIMMEDYRCGNMVLTYIPSASFYEVEYVPEIFPIEERSHILSGLKFVHQLQNLFFALTGEELKLNEA